MAITGNKRREEVEKVIKSCLVSRQGNITIEMLDNDYYEFEGEHIPFREFNFSSLSLFLRHLTDTLRLENKFSQTFVIPLDSEKSRHVRALVEGQKPKKTNHRKTQRPYLGFAGGRSQVSIHSTVMMALIGELNRNEDGISIDWAVQFVNKFSYPVEITWSELEVHCYSFQFFSIPSLT